MHCNEEAKSSQGSAKIPLSRKFVPDRKSDELDNASINSELLNSLQIPANGTRFAYRTKVGASDTKVGVSYAQRVLERNGAKGVALGLFDDERTDAHPSKRDLLRVECDESLGPALRQQRMDKATLERLERILSVVTTKRKAPLAAHNSIKLVAEREMYDQRKSSSGLQLRQAKALQAPKAGIRFCMIGRRMIDRETA